jgi:hypothetical protein
LEETLPSADAGREPVSENTIPEARSGSWTEGLLSSVVGKRWATFGDPKMAERLPETTLYYSLMPYDTLLDA